MIDEASPWGQQQVVEAAGRETNAAAHPSPTDERRLVSVGGPTFRRPDLPYIWPLCIFQIYGGQREPARDQQVRAPGDAQPPARVRLRPQEADRRQHRPLLERELRADLPAPGAT